MYNTYHSIIPLFFIVSQLSAAAMMTIPAEMYSFGISWFFSIASMALITPVLCWVIIPVFYNNNISNCYEVGLII